MFGCVLAGRADAVTIAQELRKFGKKLVFTNGCFDLLHAGHVTYLAAARQLGDALMVGVNDDASVRKLKGDGRPIMPLADRMRVLSALRSVDFVVAFSESTPADLIAAVQPDVLVKGSDYHVGDIVGRDIVESYGGRVEVVQLIPGRSTTDIIRRITGGTAKK